MLKAIKKITSVLLVLCALCGMVALTACDGGKTSEGGEPAGPLTYNFEVVYEDGTAASGAMVIACIIVEVKEDGTKVEGACQNYTANAEGKCSFQPANATDEYHLKAVKGGYVCENEYYTEGVTATFRFVLKAAE